MSIVSRGQIATIGDTIRLRTVFRALNTGAPVDTDVFPQISIQEPSGNVLSGFSSTGVYRVAVGTYGYDYNVGSTPSLGVWTDHWNGQSGANNLFNTHNFVVHYTQAPMLNTDGYVALGDDPGFDYSQSALININKLVAMLKARLNSSGKALIRDELGNEQLVDCDIYTVHQLMLFLISSLSIFNSMPHFTGFTFEDSEFLRIFGELIVRGATVSALSAKALIERGREFQITDNGVGFQPPGVSDMLNTQYSTEYTNWETDVKLVKSHMKPGPMGLASYPTISAANPAWMRLRHLRARQVW